MRIVARQRLVDAALVLVAALPAARAHALPPSNVSDFPVALGDRVVFSAFHAAVGPEPWASDGTLAGTRLLADATPGATGSTLVVFDGDAERLFFLVYADHLHHADDDSQLWVTDGTPAGTAPLPVRGSLTSFLPLGRAAADGALLFLAPVDFGISMWETDGTADGTRQRFRLPTESFRLHGPVAEGGSWYFTLGSFAGEDELWRTDGTAEGTEPLAGPLGFVEELGGLPGGGVVVVVDAVGGGHELWSSDGTAAGTRRLATFDGIFDPGRGRIHRVAGGAVFWTNVGGEDSFQLWRTDGTPEGTSALGIATDLAAISGQLVAAGSLWFAADRPGSGRELWRSDGTLAGTRRIADLCPGPCSSSPESLAPFTGGVVFSADDGVHGREPWAVRAEGGPPTLLADLCPGDCSSSPRAFVLWREGLFFFTRSGDDAWELWRVPIAAGKAAGAAVRLATPPPGQGFWPLLPPVGSGLLFLFQVDYERQTLWRTDGTAAGTGPVLDLFRLPLGEPCTPDESSLCLGGGRYRVSVYGRDESRGISAPGRPRPLPVGDRAGAFWFFSADNPELVVKVLDGTTVNDFDWTFVAPLTDLEVDVEIDDSLLGLRRFLTLPEGSFCGAADLAAFPAIRDPRPVVADGAAGRGDAVTAAAAGAGGCPAGSPANALCLHDGRFRVEVEWDDPATGESSAAAPIADGPRAGGFWFFRPANPEVWVKVLDGRPVNGRFWVFHGALTSLGYRLRVTDTAGGESRLYRKAAGTLCGGADTEAF